MSKLLNLGKASTETKARLVGGFVFDGDVDPVTGRYGKEDPFPNTTCYTNDPFLGLEVPVLPSVY